jgi:hypothetical protein
VVRWLLWSPEQEIGRVRRTDNWKSWRLYGKREGTRDGRCWRWNEWERVYGTCNTLQQFQSPPHFTGNPDLIVFETEAIYISPLSPERREIYGSTCNQRNRNELSTNANITAKIEKTDVTEN